MTHRYIYVSLCGKEEEITKEEFMSRIFYNNTSMQIHLISGVEKKGDVYTHWLSYN